MFHERLAVFPIDGVDAVSEGEADSHRLIERLVFRDHVGNSSRKFEDALAGCSARFRHEDGEFVSIDACEHVEFTQVRLQGFGEKRNDPADVRGPGFGGDLGSVLKLADT